MKVGLYFGSFNPIHTGHLIIANHILNETSIKNIWFVVSPKNPLKSSGSLLNEYDRLHLVNLAIDGTPSFKASDIEFHLPKPSYTTHTLSYLKDKYPSYLFYIIMGTDSFQNLPQWKAYETIIKNYPLLIYKRPYFDIIDDYGANIQVLQAPLLEISATYIRQQVEAGKSIKYLVPPKVEEEIQAAQFFKKIHRK